MSERRQLKFDNWDQVRLDLDGLLAGYEQTGKWNLSQICLHLNDWMRFPMDGFPSPAFPMNLIVPLIRVTVGKNQLQKILANGSMPAGGPTMPNTVHQDISAEQDAKSAADLKETISRFESFAGKIYPSPIFGPMDKATAERLQLIHCAHHLSFLVPKA